MTFIVKNVKSFSGDDEGRSRLVHWKKLSKSGNAFLCSKSDCFEYPTKGARVVKLFGDDKDVKVIPLCDQCASLEGDFEVDHLTEFVPLEMERDH